MKSVFNDTKAGMSGLDREKIEKIIQQNTGAKFSNHSDKQNQRIAERAARNRHLLENIPEYQIEEAEREMDDFVDSIEAHRDLTKHKVHIDMDAFFASVEMRENPALRVIPMAVGSDNISAMPGFIAKKLCPELTIVSNHYSLYKKESSIVAAIFKSYDSNVRMGSLDEACLDLTDYEDEKLSSNVQVEKSICEKCNKERQTIIDMVTFGTDIEEVVKEIRFKVEQATGLTCSAGIACNWMLSKICSDMKKPNGQYNLKNDKHVILNFMRDLPIRKVSGIGAVTEALLKDLNINRCQDLYNKRGILKLLFSEQSAQWFMYIARGVSSSGWSDSEKEQGRKSISTERTFAPTKEITPMLIIIRDLCQELIDSIAESPRILGARAATIKIKYATFDVITRCQTVDYLINTVDTFFPIMERLFRKEMKLIGVRLSRFTRNNEDKQFTSKVHQKTLMDFLRRPNDMVPTKRFSKTDEVEVIELDSD